MEQNTEVKFSLYTSVNEDEGASRTSFYIKYKSRRLEECKGSIKKVKKTLEGLGVTLEGTGLTLYTL